VHGFLHNSSPWGYFKKQLKRGGCGSVNTVDYLSVTKDIKQNSEIIQKRINEISKAINGDIQVLIGHSQGGVESLEYALNFAPVDRTTYIITLGSPLHGTSLSKIGWGPSARDLAVDSKYFQDLHERLAQAKHIKVLALRGEADVLIIPHSSAALFEYPFAENQELPLAHLSFLFSSQTVDAVLRYLKTQKMIINSPVKN
jgi:hypothetical protein